MKVNLKDNKKWAAEERRRQKKRGSVIAGMVFLLVLLAAGTWVYRYHYVESGRYYPQIILASAPTGEEPAVYIAEDFENMVKSPSLPFTMLAAGDVVLDTEVYCIFWYQGAYYVMTETEEETADALATHIFPALGASVTGSASFNRQEGYLNNRHVETECLTVTVEQGDLYTVNCRLLFPGNRDIVISGISPDAEMGEVWRNIEKIFYSIHETIPQKTGKTQTIDLNVLGEGQPDSLIGNIVVNMEGNGAAPMDEEFFPEGTSQDEILPNPGGIHELEDQVLYKSSEEKALVVEEDFDRLAFVFSYGLPVELSSIELIGPSGDIFYPDERYQYVGYDYVFLVDSPVQGEWRFVWTAADRIGNYEGYYTKPQHYTPPAKLVRQEDTTETR